MTTRRDIIAAVRTEFHRAWLVTARIELGRAFSVQAKATTLVTTGVYSRIRNPIYFFGVVFILGIIIWIGRPRPLLIFVVLIPLQVVRSPERGAGAVGEVRRRVSRLQAEDLVLMRIIWQ
jgi:protein-S-isoprenylcysteine O-methyltransferase Ste14